MKRIAINGFGRIGRLAFRQLVNRPSFTVVGINDLTDVETVATLKYDSIHGLFPGDVTVSNGNLVVNGQEIQITAERNPADLPWAAGNVISWSSLLGSSPMQKRHLHTSRMRGRSSSLRLQRGPKRLSSV